MAEQQLKKIINKVKKIRRNDPCHCGSGKKYKKCCLTKDAAMEDDSARQEYVKPFTDGSILESGFFDDELEEDMAEVFDNAFDKYDDDPEIAEEDKKLVDEWWGTYRELKGPLDERRHLDKFIEARPDLVIHLGLQHEVLFELCSGYLKLGKIDDHIQFLIKFKERFPDTYLKSFGYYDYYIITWLISKNRVDEVSGYLENYIQYPVDHVDKLFEVVNLLLAVDMASDLHHLVKNVHIAICYSDEVFGGNEIMPPLINEIVTKYLKPDFSDNDFAGLIAELKKIKIKLNDEVYTQQYWRDIFETIFRPYTIWKPVRPFTNSKIRKMHNDMSLNYGRFLKEKTGMSWVSANYYNLQLNEYLHSWHKDTKKRDNALFDFSKNVMDKQVAVLTSKMSVFVDATKMISLFNAIFYFAEYLVVCGNINAGQALAIQNDCIGFYNQIYPNMKIQYIEALVFNKFPMWG